MPEIAPEGKEIYALMTAGGENSGTSESAAESCQPRCSIFGQCGGCQYQDISYHEELHIKSETVRRELSCCPDIPATAFKPIVPSPQIYHYRCRQDFKLLRIRSGEVFIGFSPKGKNSVIETDSCAIAMKPIADFLPELRRQALARLTTKYRNANLTVKTGADGRVVWGGIGRRSLALPPEDYLWAEVGGKKIFYSLDTFFQANLAILPEVTATVARMVPTGADVVFYDLYGGVGLFSLAVADCVGRLVLIEENVHACRMARFNFDFHKLEAKAEIVAGRLEDFFAGIVAGHQSGRNCLMIDPPRQGLSESVARLLAQCDWAEKLIYLSCNPTSLGRDLLILQEGGWAVSQVIPFDFFPRTEHVETLVELNRR